MQSTKREINWREETDHSPQKITCNYEESYRKTNEGKEKINNFQIKYQNSTVSKKFNGIRNKLLNISGPKETAVLKHRFKYTNIKGGSSN